MSRPTIIGLAGRAGSGKSTCARWLRENFGAVEFSLAEPLKRLAQKTFGFTDAQVFGTQAEKEAIDPRWGISPREALIRLGNSAREELGGDVWLNACLRRIDESGVALAVVADVRYPNEATAIAARGRVGRIYSPAGLALGFVARLSCPNAATSVDVNAPSERSVDEIDPADLAFEISIERSEGASALLEAFAAKALPYLRSVR